MASKRIQLALLATLVAAAAAGCTGGRHEGSGTNDGTTSNYRPFKYGAGNTKDMRLGLDRYRGTDPDLIRDNDSLRFGLNRDNGPDGFDNDGINNWRDYHDQTGATGTEGYNLHQNKRMEIAQDIANHLATIEPVKTANVLVTDRNCYVAVTTRNGEDVDRSLATKNRIADQVLMMHPEIKNVYVSANPDFVGMMNGFVQELNAGKPVSGMIEQFNAAMQRIFPTRSSASQANTASDGLSTKTSGPTNASTTP